MREGLLAAKLEFDPGRSVVQLSPKAWSMTSRTKLSKPGFLGSAGARDIQNANTVVANEAQELQPG